MGVPTPIILSLGSAALTVLKVIYLPQIFPDTKITTLYLQTASLVFFLWGIWKVFIYPKVASPLRHLPQPTSGTIPGIGFPELALRRQVGELMLRLITTIPNSGLIRFPGLFNADCLLLTGPSSLGEVLVHKSYDFEKPLEVRKFLRIILGDGLILVEGDVHKFQRKHIAPAFSFRHIKELHPVFWRKAVELVGCVEREILGNPVEGEEKDAQHPAGIVEINHWANKVTMDIIGTAGLGRDFNSLHNTDDELVKNYEEILEPTQEKAIFFGANLLFGPKFVAKLPWKLNQRLNATMSTLRGVCQGLVNEKKGNVKAEKQEDVDILSLMIKSDSFADGELIDQLLTFLAAGHETTSSAFTWATYLLATHPTMQSRLRAEIRSALPSPTSPSDPSIDIASILESLPYLHGVCSEVLRLYPTVPTTIRIAVRDTHINNTFIPKGTKIFISPWGVNRSPKLWGPTAASFNPERWIDEHSGKLNNHGGVESNYANLTFLHGPRSCIGEKFARSELKALVAVFCGRFEVQMEREGEVKVPAGVITTKPAGGMSLKLRVLEGW